MKFAKRLTALVAAAALTLSACSSDDDSGGTSSDGSLSGEVTMWIYPILPDEAEHRAFWDDQIEAFNEVHPDIDVNVEIYPWAGRDESLATALASNTGPDVVYLIPDQLITYASSIEPVNEHLPSELLDDLLDNVRESVTLEGNMLGMPILTSSNPLICNKNAFDAIGSEDYPQTWDDLLELAPQFAEEDIYVTNYWGSPEVTLNMTFYPLLWQAGGHVFNDDLSDVAFNSDEGIKALEFLKTLVDNGWVERDLISTTPAIEQTALASNQVACTWQSGPADVIPYWGEENVIVLDPLTDVETVAYGTVGSLSMMQSADNKEATAAWLAHATSPEVGKEFNLLSKYFSPLESTGQLYADDPVYSAIEQTIPLSTVGELAPEARQITGVLAPQIQAALLGEVSPEEALAAAATSADSLMN